MNPIVKFFHELINPHCLHCMQLEKQKREDDYLANEIRDKIQEEDKRCRSCESLERQLAVANEQILKLTEKIVNPIPSTPIVTSEASPKPLRRGPTPFSVIKQTLEKESHARAIALQNAAKPDNTTEDSKETKEEVFNDIESRVLNARTEREVSN